MKPNSNSRPNSRGSTHNGMARAPAKRGLAGQRPATGETHARWQTCKNVPELLGIYYEL